MINISELTLGDAFSRRKQIESEITTWSSRLQLAGTETTRFTTKEIESKKFEPIPGSIKVFSRNYTIQECIEALEKLIEEDKNLALRISLTNQVAKAKIIDLDGEEKELSIPALLVLKNDIAPKLENFKRAIPIRAQGVEIIEDKGEFIKYRLVTETKKSVQQMGEKGQVITNAVSDFFTIEERIDYGFNQRIVFDEIDKIHQWLVRLKEAINQANRTHLVAL